MAVAGSGSKSIGSTGKKAEGLATDISGKYSGKKDKDPVDKNSPAALRDHLKKKEGPGKAPDSSIRERLAGPIGADPAEARFHTGPAAAEAAQQLQAQAFTIGQDVFFGANKFDPKTHKGIGLIAHEATHVAQQSGIKGDGARFFSQRGGDDMEQEAQAVAELVLTNVGFGETLHVGEYVRNYSDEAGDGVSPQDRARLDAISVLALKRAQHQIRRRGIKNVPNTKEISIDVALDLAEMSDQEAAEVWCEAIVSAVEALKTPVQAPRRAVQRDPTTTTPSPPPKSNDKETLELSISSLAPYYADVVMTMSHDSDAMQKAILGMNTFESGGKGSIRVLNAILQDYLDVTNFDKSKQYYRTSHLQFVINKRADGDSDAFNRMSQEFRHAAQGAKAEVDKFLKDFMDQGKTAFLKLTAASRKAVGLKLNEYGFATSPELIKDPANYKFAGGNDISSKMKEEAKKLLPKIKKVEQDREAAENLKSWLHMHTSLNATIKAEEIMAKDLPDAEADWSRSLGEVAAKYPIMSQFQTFDQMEELANSDNPQKLILKQLVDILVNLDTLDDKVNSDPGKIVYDMPKVRQDVEKQFPQPWQVAFAEMVAEDRGDADAGWKTLLGAIGAALSLATGGAAGVGLLALEAAGAGISIAALYTEIQEYRLADAAHMSDMDVAKALSAEEPSLFWLAFDIVTTAISLRGSITKMKEAIMEINAAYKIAQASGETVALEKVLNNHSIPQDTIKLILGQAVHGAIALTNFIRNPDPVGALGVLSTFNSFMDVRTAMFKSKEDPGSIAKAKQAIQEARNNETKTAFDSIKAKHPEITVELLDEGFDAQKKIVMGSSELPAAKTPAPPPPPAAGGGGGGSGGGRTIKGSPAPDPNAHPGGTLKGSPAPDPNALPGRTLRGSPAPDPNVGPHGTLKGLGNAPKGPPVPDGVYDVNDPALGKTAPADPALAKTDKPPSTDPALAKTGQAPDPALAKTGQAPDPALAKTPVAAPKLQAAVNEAKNMTNTGGASLANVYDWDILDKSAATDTLDGSKAQPAPMGSLPADAPQEQQGYAQLSKALADRKGIEGYYGTWVRLPSDRFVVEAGASGGTSYKYILRDIKTGKRYLFKPGVGEPPLQMFGHKAHGNTLYVRSGVASDIAQKMPTVAPDMPPVTIVVHDGRVGSLQPFVEGTKSLRDLMAVPDNDPQGGAKEKALFNKLMEENPGFQKFRNNLRAFDHVINNSDREANFDNILVEVDANNNPTRFYAIDNDATLSPGARELRDNPLQPRLDLNESWTDPSKPVIGKISQTLYNEMVAMVANEATVRANWKGGFAITDEAINGIFGRMKQIVRDYSDRLSKSKPEEVFFVD